MVSKPQYVDVNIFVYWLGSHPEFTETAKQFVRKMEKSPRGEYVTSAITPYEALVVLAGLSGKNCKDKNFVTQIIRAITRIKGLVIEPLKPEDLLKATELMNECKLDYEDSLHLAVATRVGASRIISNDRDFDSTTLKRIM